MFSLKWFVLGNAIGCACLWIGTMESLPVYLLGLLLLLPGSALAALTTPECLMRHYVGTMPVSDFLYLPVAVAINIVVFAAVRRIARKRL